MNDKSLWYIWSGTERYSYLSESIDRTKKHLDKINLGLTACMVQQSDRGRMGEVWLVPIYL